MAKSKIEKKDVSKAIEALRADGKNPTIAAIRAAMGNQGSLTTIQQFKKELIDAEISARDSPEALVAFRSIWSSALEEGRRQRDDEIRDLHETAEALSSELKKSEGEAIAYRTTATDAIRKYESTVGKLSAMSAELAEARTISERNATKLIEIIEQHHQNEQKLRDQIVLAQTPPEHRIQKAS